MMHIPGMKNINKFDSSSPVFSHPLKFLEKIRINNIKSNAIDKLITKDDQAIFFFSFSSFEVLTNLICALLSNPFLESSYTVIITMKMAQIPIWFLVKCLASSIKLKKPNKVPENLCKMFKNDDFIQYEENIFFK